MKSNKKFYKGLAKNSLTYKTFLAIIYLLNPNKQSINHLLPELVFKGNIDLLAKKIYKRYNNQQKLNSNNQNLNPKIIKRAIKRLESLDYIKLKSVNQKLNISLTRKGSQEYLRYKINQNKNKKWDKKWRLVIFDILENKRQARDLLRRNLKQFGFKELQKSVWIFPYDIRKELNQLLDICNLNIIGDIRFLTVENMDKDRDLKIEFGLLTKK